MKLLILEDNADDAALMQVTLKRAGLHFKAKVVSSRKDFTDAFDSFIPDVILSDHKLPGLYSNQALKLVRDKLPHVPFILVTGTVSEEFAASIIKEGADDYILKDRMARLPGAIEAALNQRKAHKEIIDYKYALDQSAIVAITDQKGIIIYANENFSKISGYSVKELIGQDHRIINSGYHSKSYIKNLWVTIANRKVWRGEFRNKAKDRSFYWVDTTIIPFLNEKGKPYQYLSIRNDITEKIKAKEELQNAYERLSFHIENTPLGFIEWDNQLHVKKWSSQAEKIFGWTQDELIALEKDGYSQVYEDDLLVASKIAEELITGKVDRNSVQHRNNTKGGTVIWCEWFNSVLKDAQGTVITILSLVQDITERKKAEEHLLQSEMRLNQSQEIAHLGNWEVNFETNISKWSDEAYRIYGLTPGDPSFSMEEWISMVHPDDLVYVKNEIEKSQTALSDIALHYRIIRKDGVVRNVYSESKYEFSNEGRLVGLYGIVQDITQRKEAEDALQSMERQILHQKIQEQKKIARAMIKAEEKEKNHLGRELHDNVNQLLAGTKLYLSMAGNKNAQLKKLVKYPIELIDNSIEEIRALCREMVTPVKNIDLKEMIEQLLNKLSQSTIIKTSFTYSVSGETLSDDFKLNIYRIMQEQTNNIVKYAEAKNVNISITEQGSVIKIITTDDGKGFNVRSKRKGIGLSNMINRIESYNGKVKIKSSVGNGCKIEVAVPLDNVAK